MQPLAISVDPCCCRADRNIGKYYSSFIFPYKGAFGTGSPDRTNRFWAVPGNHDVSGWAA
jgi:hypothetical protein